MVRYMNTVLITGASRGIGRATALLAAQRGWSVAINYRNDARAAAEVAAAAERRGARATTIQGDVSEEADVVAMFAKAQADLGRLTGVVINAGIVAPAMRLADMSAERMERVFRVNVLGAYLCAREAARTLPRNRGGSGGSVVLVSSIAARLGAPGEYVDYAGSKAAVDTLALGLARELGADGVRANAVRPGLIETEIHADSGDPDRPRKLGSATALGRAGRPEEVAEAIVWLLSDAASYVTGAVLDVAAGR
ncbi:MAG TPA: SDR family oxidoreductase [Steroidobacteraceae bacterium]|nr:SDR family oxidoreductase [Steroidobacteraceae bacterium]